MKPLAWIRYSKERVEHERRVKMRNKLWGVSTFKNKVEKVEVERRLASIGQRVWGKNATANAKGKDFWKMEKTS